MANLHEDEIVSAKLRTDVDYPDAREALNVYAARLLTILADKHESNAAWNERRTTMIEKHLDKIRKEIGDDA